MPATLSGQLDCQETAHHYLALVKSNVNKLSFSPGLGVILGSEDVGSVTYQRWLMKDCEEAGINATDLRVENGMQMVKLVARLNQDDKTHGVFIFYPLRYP